MYATKCGDGAELHRLFSGDKFFGGACASLKLFNDFAGIQPTFLEFQRRDPARTVDTFGDEQIVASRSLPSERRTRFVEVDDQTGFWRVFKGYAATIPAAFRC